MTKSKIAPATKSIKTPALLPALAALALALTLNLASAGPALAQHHHGHGSPSGGASAIYSTTGVVKEINPGAGYMVVDHGPVEAVGWGPMVMGFKVDDPGILDGVSAGDRIRFDIRFDSPNDYVVVDVEKLD